MTLRVAVLTEDPDGPSARHRWRYAAPHLEEHGVTISLHAVEPRAERAAAFEAAGEADLTVVHRKLFRWPDLRRLLARTRGRGRRIVFDLDDAVMFRPPGRRRQWSVQRWIRFTRMLRSCSLFLAGNDYLLARAPQRVMSVVQPTPVDIDRYTPREPGVGDGRVLGWIGGRATLRFLAVVAPALTVLAKERADLVLRVIGPEPEPIPGVTIEHVPWTEAGEAGALRTLDIGLMPLTDDRFSRGKCAFKILQYMATGLPVVASPVGANRDVIVHGETGFLAATTEDWCGHLGRLLDGADLRETMGRAGRDRVAERYATSVLGPLLAGRLRAVAGRT